MGCGAGCAAWARQLHNCAYMLTDRSLYMLSRQYLLRL